MEKIEEIKNLIIYEDNHVMVVVKPYNVPVQEDSSKDDDLLNLLKNYIKVRDNKQGNVFLGLVHRLDRTTGGVMVFAKTSKAASRLTEQMQNDEFCKKYLTVVVNEPKEKSGVLKNYLMKNEKTNNVMVVPSARMGAKYAELNYNVLETNDNLCLLSVELKTGRSHQIRVQLANINHSIVGDARYGIPTSSKIHMALWAYNLKFTHPTTKKILNFLVYPPEEDKIWGKFDIKKYLLITNTNSN